MAHSSSPPTWVVQNGTARQIVAIAVAEREKPAVAVREKAAPPPASCRAGFPRRRSQPGRLVLLTCCCARAGPAASRCAFSSACQTVRAGQIVCLGLRHPRGAHLLRDSASRDLCCAARATTPLSSLSSLARLSSPLMASRLSVACSCARKSTRWAHTVDKWSHGHMAVQGWRCLPAQRRGPRTGSY